MSSVDVSYDYASPEVRADPYPAYAQLRKSAPVHHDEQHDLWALSRYVDVQAAFRDWGTFTSAEGVDPDGLAFDGGFEALLVMDPPRHDVLRKLLRDRFTPKAVRSRAAQAQQVICPLVADAVRADRADLARFGESVALAAMTDFMGLSAAAGQRLQAAQRQSLERFSDGAPSISDSVAMFASVMDEELELRHREERDDMTAAVAVGEATGIVDRPEAISMCAVAFFGALDTTAAAIGNTLYLLAEHPGSRASVVRGDVAVADAIEECIRYHAPIQWVMRTTTRAVELHDRTIPEGARVLLLQGSANRDPEQFTDADVLDFARPRQRHMSFGEGVHFCIGAPLARQWATIAISELLQYVPGYTLDGPAVREARPDGYGLDTMPVRLRP